MCMCVVARHWRPKGIRWNKEKKGEKTETDMQSKAIEGVPCRAHAHHSLLIFLSLSSCACVGRNIPFSLSPSLSFGSCWFNLRGLLHHYHRPSACWKEKRARRKRARVAHTKGQLDRATRTIKEWVKQEHDFSFIIVIMAVEASTDFFSQSLCALDRET